MGEAWRRLCEARRRAFERVRANGSPEDVYLAILEEERRAIEPFLNAAPTAESRG